MEKGIVAGALFLTSLLSPAPTPAPKTSQIPPQEMGIYRVKEGDSLQSIAKAKYGSEDYWTNIVADNEIIKDPNLIEKDWELKIEIKKTDKPKEINIEVVQKSVPQTQAQAVEKSIIQPTPSVNSSVAQSPTPTALQTPAATPRSLTEAQINFLGSCESGMTASRNSGNGFYGAFQFTIGTWKSMGTGYERADLAPIEVQIDAVQRLVARSNIFGQLPACSTRMRSLGLL